MKLQDRRSLGPESPTGGEMPRRAWTRRIHTGMLQDPELDCHWVKPWAFGGCFLQQQRSALSCACQVQGLKNIIRNFFGWQDTPVLPTTFSSLYCGPALLHQGFSEANRKRDAEHFTP